MKLRYIFLLITIFLLLSTLFTGCGKTEVENIESEEKAQESSEEVVSGLQDIAKDLSDIEGIVE